jgi:hypothetical protein
MLDWMLGKRNGGRHGAVPAGAYLETRMPWEPDGNVVAGFAISNLIDDMMSDLKGPRGVHVETLMTMVGALAGFSAQHAIWETIVKPGKLPAHGGADLAGGAFVIANTHTSEKYYFGDLLNSYLIPQGGKLAAFGPGPHTLWGFVASAVVQCGRKPLTVEDIQDVFRHAAATVGTAQFGEPRLPREHRPAMMPRNALNREWPKARAILARQDAPGAQGRSLAPGHWPTAIALVAQKLVLQTRDVIDPTLSMRILFEAAVPMSKVDRATVP